LPYLEHPKKLLRQNAQVAFQRGELGKLAGSPALSFPSLFSAKPDVAMKKTKDTPGNLLEIEKVLILRRTSMFGHTPESVLADLAGIIQEERVPAGNTVFEMGDLGQCMYIIYEGEVRIHAGSTELARLGNRDFFGELALLDPEPRSASATTLADTFLLRIDQQAFFELIDERPEVGKGILKVLCQRLRRQNNLIRELKPRQAVSVS
jgi:CRP-like cAMP-binding protein